MIPKIKSTWNQTLYWFIEWALNDTLLNQKKKNLANEMILCMTNEALSMLDLVLGLVKIVPSQALAL